MITIYDDAHRLHAGGSELVGGRLVPCFDGPERAESVLAGVRAAALGEVRAPEPSGAAAIERVHAPDYLVFLESAWEAWRAAHPEEDRSALPNSWPRSTARLVEPRSIDGRLAYHATDAATPITAGTWRAAVASAGCALTGAGLLTAGRRSAFALCRPPGHHAHRDRYGGYCFLNNAALAAEKLRDAGAARVAVLDVDYHHGNGTQEIFYRRHDVLFASIHADPRDEYPYFAGHADETGAGAGEGFNLNLPLPVHAPAASWLEALDTACARVGAFAPDGLVVSLGVDTYEGDPISRSSLGAGDFPRLGERIARLRLPTLFVLEGGYAVDALGENVAAVLTGFEGGAA